MAAETCLTSTYVCPCSTLVSMRPPHKASPWLSIFDEQNPLHSTCCAHCLTCACCHTSVRHGHSGRGVAVD